MARDDFNPQAPLDQAKDYLQYSRGVRDNSLGDFVSGVAQGLDVGAKALDRGVDRMARDEVNDIVAETDAKYLGINNQPPRKDPLDAEVRGQVRNLENKKLAMDAGTIDPQHYYATIQAKTKDIRARYSGYNETIDEELQKLGIDPNWQRKQIIEEGMKAQAAKGAATTEALKNDREFAEKYMADPKMLIDGDLRAAWARDPNFHADPKNMIRLKAQIGRSTAMWANMEAESQEIKLLGEKDKGGSLRAATGYNKELQTFLHIGLYNSGAYKVVQDVIRQSQDEMTRTGVLSTETEDKLKLGMQKLRLEAEQARLVAARNYSDVPFNWADDKKKIDDEYTNQLNNIESAINNKQWGLVDWNMNRAKAVVESEKNDTLTNSVYARRLAAAKDIYGDTVTNNIYMQSRSAHDAPTAALLTGLEIDQASGEIKSLNDSMKKMREGGVEDPKAYRDKFQQSLNIVMNKDIKPQTRLTTFETLYSQENQGFWDNLMKNKGLADKDRRAYFRTLTSPQMQASVKELGQYDRQANRKYYDYVQYMFNSMNANTADSVNDTIVNSSSNTITYNPVTHHLEMQAVEGEQGFFSKLWDSSRSGEDAVENFNQGVDALLPLLKEQGLKPEVVIPTLIERMGINLSADKEGNAIEMLKSKAKSDAETVKKRREGVGITGSQGSNDAGGGEGNDRLNPRGAPTAEITPENQAYATEVMDMLTGIPSFVDAVNSGDPKEIAKQAALAMATILPFPAGKLAKAGEAIAGGAKVIEPITLEARRIARELDGLPSNANTDTLRGIQDNLSKARETTSKLSSKLRTELEKLPKAEQDRILASMGKKSLDDI